MIPQANDIHVRAGTASGRPRRTGARGFTLLEILIAVAALGLIAVGVASIFDATGKTLATGKRVSAFNAYASLIEQQIRSDIAAMAPDGFLVIRNEYASAQGNATVNVLPNTGNPDAVPLFDGDENGRLRRIDEIMFFAKGEFTSARAALHPDYIAKSDAARIYYGHGQKARQPITFNETEPYYTPPLDGVVWNSQTYDADARLGFDTSADPPNPNRFASDWILLRHVTLLAPPRTSQSPPQGSIFEFGQNNAALLDSPLQISLQPAAPDIFRRLSGLLPVAPLPPAIRAGPRVFGGNLVDIAATDLAKIRSVVTTASVFPNGADNRFYNPNANADPASEANNAGADGQFRLYGLGAPQDAQIISRIQAWMDDAFPAHSMSQTATQRERIRCEASPRNYLGTLDPNQGYTLSEAAYRPADQVMLSASNFLPRCTEFIVEWSFGKTFPTDPGAFGYVASLAGQTLWNGMERRVGGNVVTGPYISTDLTQVNTVPYRLNSGVLQNHPVLTSIIHGQAVAANPPLAGAPLTSYFGYYDPTFNPDKNNDGKIDNDADAASATIPWAWPKLIRVTLSLADPADPTVERTFQFVFEVPSRGGV